MIVIRLFRTGKKNQPFFRIVVTDKRKPPKSGRFIEILGFYNPLTKERAIKKERVEYWLSQGAKVSDTVHNLLVKEGVLRAAKISVHKKAKKKEEEKPSSIKATEGKKEETKPEESLENKKETAEEIKEEGPKKEEEKQAEEKKVEEKAEKKEESKPAEKIDKKEKEE